MNEAERMTWTKLAASFLTVFALLIIWMTLEIWAAAFLGILFALSLNGPAAWIRQHVRMPSWLASLLVILAVLVLFIGLGLVIGPSLSGQLDDMSAKLPNAVEGVLQWLDARPGGQRIVESLADWSGMPKEELLGNSGGSNSSGNDVSNSAIPSGVLQLVVAMVLIQQLYIRHGLQKSIEVTGG